MSSDKMREEFEAWHCEQYKTKHTTGAPTRDMHNGVWDQDYCSKKSQALWALWQATGGDVTKVEALKEEIERIEEGKQPVAWFRPDALGCAVWKPFATQTLKDGAPLFTRPDSGDVIREMNDELVDLRARLAEAQEVLRDCIEIGELDAETQWKAERVSKGRRVYVDDRALSARTEPGAPVERKQHIPRTDAVYDASWVSEKLPVPKCMDVIRPIPLRDILRDLVAEVIGGDTYDCTRVWSAWGVGTMSEDDFIPLTEQDERLYEIAGAILEKFKELSQ